MTSPSPDTTAAPTDALPAWSHTEVKKHGLRGLLEFVELRGAARLVNHGRTTGVVLTPEAYAELQRRAELAPTEDPLAALRRQFDERLAQLERRGAPERLEAAFDARTLEMARLAEPPLVAG